MVLNDFGFLCATGCHAFLFGGHVRAHQCASSKKQTSSHAKHGQSSASQTPGCCAESNCNRGWPKPGDKTYRWSGNVRVATLVSPASRTFAEEYKLLDSKIGSGVSGNIFLAVSQHSSPQGLTSHVAVKTLTKKCASERAIARALQEADIYLRMDHINITRLLRVYNEPDNLHMVMEYSSGGSLADHILKHRRFTENEAARAAKHMLAAINYCHKHSGGKVCHRDVKHANFVYASAAHDAPLKLLDFGLSRVLSEKRPYMNKYAGTPHYLAPEVIKRRAYTESCDIWSIGVIVFSLLNGRMPFHGNTVEDVERATFACELNMKGSAWHCVSDLAKDFVAGLLEKKPAFRPTAADALQHPWFSMDTRKRQVSPEILQGLVRFANESHICRAAAASLVYAQGMLVAEDFRSLEAQFQMLDANEDGSVSVSELSVALNRTLGTSPEDAQKIFRTLDLDGDAGIQYSEFLAAMVGTKVLGQPGAKEEAFKHFDLVGKGTIQLSEFEAILGGQFCGTSTSQIFVALDMNDDDRVDLQEFTASILQVKGKCTNEPPVAKIDEVQPPLKTSSSVFALPSEGSRLCTFGCKCQHCSWQSS